MLILKENYEYSLLYKVIIKMASSNLTCILEQCFIFSSCGIVFVTTTASKQALLMREIAGPEKMPWVKMAYTFVAPAEISLTENETIWSVK